MAALRYSVSQIEAFAAVAQSGTVSGAAVALGKDRTTIRDLLDYLEDALGYILFVREGRKLTLTPAGEQLHRQAHLLVRQAHAFESFARSLSEPQPKEMTLAYDPFVPETFLQQIISELTARHIRLSLWCASRQEAEDALKSGQADIAICQAINRTLGRDLEWCALGAIELNFYGASALFSQHTLPLTLLNLSLEPQLVMHASCDEQVAHRLQISGQSLLINERTMLRRMMEQGQGWGFLPRHFHAENWQNVQALETEVGHQGLSLTLVTLWAPGARKNLLIDDAILRLQMLWQEGSY